MLRCTRHLLDTKTLIQLYYSFIYPYLTYCLDVWGHCNNSLFQSIFKIQKRAVRTITNSHSRAHSEELFRFLKIEPLLNIYILAISKFMFKFNFNHLPQVCNDLFTTNSRVHSYNTRQHNLIHVPLSRTQFAKKSIRIRGVYIWNQIATSVETNTSPNIFKKRLIVFLQSNTIRLVPMQ